MSLSFGWWDHFERIEGMSLREQYLDRIKMVQLAEAIGIERYHLAEHHFTDLDMAPSPLLFLGILAQQTSRIRLAPLVLCLPFYEPARLLQEICMVDHLSAGRLELGVGRGVRDIDHLWLSSDPMDARARFDETLQILQQGLLTGRINHHGKYFNFDDVPVRFTPHQEWIRFWYAGNYDFAGRNAMSCIGSGAREQIDHYWKLFEAGRHSKDPRFDGAEPRAGSTQHLFVAATDREAKAVARRAWLAYGEHFWCTQVQVEGHFIPKFTLAGFGGEDADERMETGELVAGSVETVRNHLLQVLERGGPRYNYMVTAFQWGDITREEANSSMSLFGEHVMPALREAHDAMTSPERAPS